jgi:glycosyltransferase involved in cell wall biosynthesis
VTQSLHVLAVEPCYGGSHRAFLDGVVRHSRHRWTLVTAPGRHWKWRMRVAPLALAHAASDAVDRSQPPDIIFCSEMLDLPSWLGLVGSVESKFASWHAIPTACYFHENQWTYPQSPRSRVDFHYGYTNLLTAVRSTACLFNSHFHRDSFLNASESFVDRMPDSQDAHGFAALRAKSLVIPPGFDPPHELAEGRGQPPRSGPIRIGWVSRWEYDKRPDLFLQLLRRLERCGTEFRLILLGSRTAATPELTSIEQEFGSHMLHCGYANTHEEYWAWLQQIDVVVSTADHEFFGIAVCEAIWAGAAAVLPNRLSYPELVSPECLYDSLDDAQRLIGSLLLPAQRAALAGAARAEIAKFQMRSTVRRLDETLDRLVRP